jgi:hypothetical protein
MDAAVARLQRWRDGFARATGPSAADLVIQLRAALRGGIDTQVAIDAVDDWVADKGDEAAAPGQAATAVDALLGIV